MNTQTDQAPKRKNPPSTYCMVLRGTQWTVRHGNKIIFTGDEAACEALLREKLHRRPTN